MIMIMINDNDNDNDSNNDNDLREVGVSSRIILHVRSRGSKSRFRVAGDAAGQPHKTY